MKINQDVEFDTQQVDGFYFLTKRNCGFLNYETGSGKSLISIMTSFYQVKNNIVDKYIIVSPKSGLISINEDFLDHTDYNPDIIETFEDLKTFLTDNRKIVIANYNIIKDCIAYVKNNKGGLNEIIKTELHELLLKIKLGVIFDEFHTLKNPATSDTAKFWLIFRPFISYCYGLTATSYFQDIEDIYHLVNFLDPKFFKNISAFRNAYTHWEMVKLFNKKYIPVIKALKDLDLLKEKLSSIMCTYASNLNTQYIKHDCILTEDSKKAYYRAAKGLHDVTKIKNQKEKKKQWSARLPDLQRVTNADLNKLETLKNLIIDLKDKGFIIYCNLMDSIEIVKQQLEIYNIQYEEITGAVSSKKRIKYKNWFNSDPKNKCLIISDAGGQSLNLQSVNNLICFDLPFGIGKFIQIRGRIVRKFSKHDIFYIHFIITEDTIDNYKYSRITQQEESYKKLFGLSVASADAEFNNFNTYINDLLKDKFLWGK